MNELIGGLVLFLGVHSTRVWADHKRNQLIEQWGEKTFKGICALLSLVGLGLVCFGYGQARIEPVVLWVPPVATRHIAALLMLLSMVLLMGAYLRGNWFKVHLRHPMVISVKVWALAHLLANGNLADVLLFGGFLLWSVVSFRAARARDRLLDAPSEPHQPLATTKAVVLGVSVWLAMVFFAHAWLFGVSPLGLSAAALG